MKETGEGEKSVGGGKRDARGIIKREIEGEG
jgi:hypothetical protein